MIHFSITSDLLSLVASCATLAERANIGAARGVCVAGACEALASTDGEASLVSSGFDWTSDWVLVPAGKLLGALKAIGSGEATWEVVGEVVKICSGKTRFTIPLLPKGEFPRAEILKTGTQLAITRAEVDAGRFLGSLDAVVHACATESARFTMTGVCVDGGAMVATDGRRLAKAEIGQEFEANKQFVVPAKVIGMLRSVFADAEKVTVSLTANALAVASDKAIVATQLVEGKFPDYRSILPRRFEHEITISGAEFAAAIRRAMVMVDTGVKRMNMDFTAGQVGFSCKTTEGGEAFSELAVDWSGPDANISVNPQFVLQALKSAKANEISLRVNLGGKPIVFQSGNFLSMIMPMG
jgi:DNA polymerase-3 subunit beta